ncbi:MAG: YceI family protein [Deltaproteobacteria bacterium]|nr:YceI family protein [Deltaproteobacteria bacterium]
MTFKSTKVVSTGQDTAKVHGDLTIKDVTKPVVLDLTHLGTVEKDPWGNTRAAFSATTTINRKEFHVQEDSAADLAIGHDITIELDIVAIKPAE